jgi:hypothetical protein
MGSVVSDYFGSKGKSGAADWATGVADKYAQEVYFKPYTMISGTGETSYDPETGKWKSALSQPFQGAQDVALSGATNLLGQLGTFSPQQRQSEIYQDLFKQQSELLQPQFQAQAAQLQNKLFGGGRLGLRLAAEGQGLGQGGGMVQPDALGLGRQQQQTMAQLSADTSAKAYDQALAELQGLSTAGTGLLSGGVETGKLEQALMGLGIDAETARAAAAGMAGNIGTTALADRMAMRADAAQQKGNMFGNIVSSIPGL